MSLAGLLLLLMWDRSAQDKFCHTIMGEGMQTPCHRVFTFAFTFDCIRGTWRGGHHSNPKQGLRSCRSARGASMEEAETWFSLSCAMERLWGNSYSEVCLGFDLSPRDPPGQLTHSQSVPFIYDSRINTFQAER